MERKLDYEYLAFDAQYILYRNFAALCSRTSFDFVATLTEDEGDSTVGYPIKKYNFEVQDLVKQFFWSIVKVIRDDYAVGKVLLLWDYPPYYKTEILPSYKGTRTHYCQEYLDEYDIKNDPNGYLQAKEDVRAHEIMSEAKWWIIDKLNQFGMVSVIYKGYEADDLAYIFSTLIEENRGIKSAICSADSDWSFWISHKVDWINFNSKEFWTYDDVCKKTNDYPSKLGLSLFDTKKWIDSLMGSHNDIEYTSKVYSYNELETIYNEVKNGDYTNITSKEDLDKNLKSFDIMNYPDIERVKEDIIFSWFSGKIGDMEYYDWLKRSDGFKPSKSYCENYLTLLSPKYYN